MKRNADTRGDWCRQYSMYLLPPSLPQQITGSESDMNIVVGAEVDPVEFDKQTE